MATQPPFKTITDQNFSLEYGFAPIQDTSTNKREVMIPCLLSWSDQNQNQKQNQKSPITNIKPINHLIWLIDVSRSMCDRIASSPDDEKEFGICTKQNVLRKSLLATLKFLADWQQSEVRLTILFFWEDIKVATNDLPVNAETLKQLTDTINKQGIHSGTNIRKALHEANKLYNDIKSKQSSDTTHTTHTYKIILMTDGENSNRANDIPMITEFNEMGLKKDTCCLGLGEAKNYDAKILSQLSDSMRGGQTARELVDFMLLYCFNACTTKAKNIQFDFPANGDIEIEIETTLLKDPTSNTKLFLKSINLDQKIPILFRFKHDPKDIADSKSIQIKVEYEDLFGTKNTIILKYTFTSGPTILKDHIDDAMIMRAYCKYSSDYAKAFTNTDPKEVIARLNALVMKLKEWKLGKRTGKRLSEAWTCLETDIANQLDRIQQLDNSNESESMTRMLELGNIQCLQQTQEGSYTTMSTLTRAITTGYYSTTTTTKTTLGDMDKCIYCFTDKRSIIFVPCGHTIACANCEKACLETNDNKCGICRQKIGALIKGTIPNEVTNMLCLKCNKRSCNTVLIGCRHICLCKDCAHETNKQKCPVSDCTQLVGKTFEIYRA